jgi:thioredoxin reductase (NADPH)
MVRLDAAIIGSGPAGLEAAINLKIRGKSFLLFGTPELSRKLEMAPRIDNYLGLPGIAGSDLKARFLEHIRSMEIEVTPEQVQMAYPMGQYFSLSAGKNIYEATTLIIATGAFQAKLLDGEDAFLGRGVSYCATCDAPLYKGKTVAVLGYSEEAVHEANFLADIAGTVYYVPAKKTEAMPRTGVEILTGKVVGVAGAGKIDSLVFEDRTVPVDGVCILRDAVVPSSLVSGIALDNGYIKVNAAMETNLPGCYAAGDCTGKPHQFLRAAGQGQTAALNAVSYLDSIK